MSSPAEFLLGSKLLFNSTFSDARRGAIVMSCSLKDFFLETPMSIVDYMIIHLKYFPPGSRSLYQIGVIIEEDGYVYIKLIKGMYGLKQADIIAYNQLISHMKPHDYYT